PHIGARQVRDGGLGDGIDPHHGIPGIGGPKPSSRHHDGPPKRAGKGIGDLLPETARILLPTLGYGPIAGAVLPPPQCTIVARYRSARIDRAVCVRLATTPPASPPPARLTKT